MKWRTSAALIAAPAILASAACAGRPGGPPGAAPIPGERAAAAPSALLLTSFDADGDLAVTMAEVEAGGAREFTRADADRDGALSPFEYTAWAEAALGGMHAPRRLEFDANVDNAITAAEFAAALTALASAQDRDGDGAIVRAELIRERPQAMEAGPARAPMGRGAAPRRRPPT